MSGIKHYQMEKIKKSKSTNPSSYPYEMLLKELLKEQFDFKLSPVVEYALNVYREKSPLILMAKFSDNLRIKFISQISLRNYKGIVEIANQLNWEIIGTPNPNPVSTKIDRPFFGCQTISKGNNKIYLANDSSILLARATVAHEIMHSLFSTINNNRPGNLPSDTIEEILCDYGAARFLISDSDLQNELASDIRLNLAEKIVFLSNYLKVPKNYIAYRIFDILAEANNTKNISAVIEWGIKKNGPDGSHKLIPVWSISKNFFIPSKIDNFCSAKEDSVIYKTFMSRNINEDDFNVSNAIENVSIGSLKGAFEIFVCTFGKLDTPHRYAISVFVPR